MEKQYLTLDELQIGNYYWVVNGCWEFMVLDITDRYIDIYITYLKEKSLLLRNSDLVLQIIPKK